MIEMRRKKPEETLDRFLHHKVEMELKNLARKISRWSKDNFESLKIAEPETLAELNDRAFDNWRPLLAIADLIGGECSHAGKQAAITLSKTKEDENASAGIMLLQDINAIFLEEKFMTRISTEDLLAQLISLDDRPWAEWNRGRELTARQLSRHLKPYDINSKTMRIGQMTKKGYDREFFNDAFDRYLSVTPLQTNQSESYGDLK
jgi:putative DNA primase/helicase